jgi:hypothetical protein
MSATSPDTRPQGRSLIGLFSDLWRETSTLVREEAELAKAEITEKVSQVETGIASLAVGGAVLFAGLLVLLQAAIGALDVVLSTETAPWLSPLIVGAVVVIIGFVLLARGRNKLKKDAMRPSRTARSLRRDTELAREYLR